ncbi:Nif3-like dinuclear metal center hexameric protein [Tenacibaculum sp. IB213877]|uniref:Nif3-like dinuclear metal center hexameric protein n=1 Tax=Tenacibaculum sp. IB213877 TaxID=3097351 RepID=UPI002A5A097A|nr:Nif3-like dinuclear metal center hexameric protein [Tenacibaculum sp. IB213877]MDY0781090.1 Nif3-like dinuclear metal center hexameric protein [Tenacibaculum sp. IB213877]
MQVKDITNYIEQLAPLSYAEDFDNVGLLIGSYDTTVTGVLVTLDTLEETVDEAIAKNCNLIVSFHPIIFTGLKKLNGNNYVEKVVLKAIQHNIAIYATHTALDNSNNGVSAKMSEVLGLENCKVLIPKSKVIKKLTTFVPHESAFDVREKLFEAGAGNIGNYDMCSFNFEGRGSYRGNEDSNPTIGKKGELISEKETCITVVFESYLEGKILKTLFKHHPYEEVAYEIITLDNSNQNVGMGMIGNLPSGMDEKSFLQFVKKTFKTDCVRHSQHIGKPIKKVAVLGGSGSFAINNAIKANADAYISADFKYHEFFKAEKKILLADVGHYESEQFTKNLLVEYLNKKFSTFAIILSEKSTNPIHYI